MKFRLHIVNLPHTEVTKEYLSCAYTQKTLNFCKMIKSLGHEVYLYAGGDKTDAPCDEFISCISKSEQEQFFGAVDIKKDFYPIEWDENLPYWKMMNSRAVAEITKRKEPRDFICLIGGTCQKPIADGLSGMSVVEFGVGYKGIFAKYRVFESYAWMHHAYGLTGVENGQNFDAVIPNYFDSVEFPLVENPTKDYYLYIGRLVARKGAHIAAEATGMSGEKLIMAGQGVISNEPGKIVAKELTLEGNHIKHIGTVGIEERGKLMANAKAVFVPTQYIEPFAGTHIEAMLCGTPVITTDWGVFTETVTNGFNGYRTRSMGEIQWAMKQVDTLDRKAIRTWAIKNFDLERVKMQYQYFFEQLYALWDENGWYSNWHEGIANNRYSNYRP